MSTVRYQKLSYDQLKRCTSLLPHTHIYIYIYGPALASCSWQAANFTSKRFVNTIFMRFAPDHTQKPQNSPFFHGKCPPPVKHVQIEFHMHVSHSQNVRTACGSSNTTRSTFTWGSWDHSQISMKKWWGSEVHISWALTDKELSWWVQHRLAVCMVAFVAGYTYEADEKMQ